MAKTVNATNAAVDKVLEEMLKAEADSARSRGRSIEWTSRVQMLRAYKHDIAERHACSIGGYLDLILTGDSGDDDDDDGDDDAFRRSFHRKGNRVKAMHELIDRCLESEDGAMKFLRALFQKEMYLYLDLLESGPNGKFVRRDPPAVELTEKVRSALGEKVGRLKNITATPSYRNKIHRIDPALDVLMQYGQLLPEEYAEFYLHEGNDAAMTRLLRELCSDTGIPLANREFVSLVVASFNMHAFDLPTMSMKDVLVFVKQ